MRLILLALATTALIGTAAAQPTLQNRPVITHVTPPAGAAGAVAHAPVAGVPGTAGLAPQAPGQGGCPGVLADKNGDDRHGENPHEGPPHGTNSQAMLTPGGGGGSFGPGAHPGTQGMPENPQPHENDPGGPPHGTNSQAMTVQGAGGHSPNIIAQGGSPANPGGHPGAQGQSDHENPQPHENGPVEPPHGTNSQAMTMQGSGAASPHIIAQGGTSATSHAPSINGPAAPGNGPLQCPSANAIVSPR